MAISPEEYSALRSRLDAFETLQEIARELTAQLDLETLLKEILTGGMDVSRSTAGSLLLHEPATHELVFKVVVGGGGEALKGTRLDVNQGIAGQSFAEQRPVIVDNAPSDPRHYSGVASSVGLQIRQLMAVPLVRQTKSIGVLEVMNPASGAPYTGDDAQLLMAFAAQSAIAIENATLYGQVLWERDRILSAEAAIRHELARDLHDGPTQMLSALIMELRFVRELLTRDVTRVSTELEQMEAIAQKALYQTRNILFDLRPVVLEQQGLAPALEQYVMRLRMIEPFNIFLDVSSLRTRLSPKVEGAVFSIVQEAVNNSKKHSHAQNLWIEAHENETGLTVQVRDDGQGFDVEKTTTNYGERGSLGLLNMRERVELAHANLSIESDPATGTQITLLVPRPS